MSLFRWIRRLLAPREGRRVDETPTGAPRLGPMYGPEIQELIDRAQLFADQINESIRLSINSGNPETKVSRIEFAKARLDELEALCAANPYITITSHSEIRELLESTSIKYAEGGLYARVGADQLNHRMRRSDFRAIDINSLASGHMFCATMQLNTPLRYLMKHGERHEGPLTDDEKVPQQYGIWVPALPGQTELYGQMASDVGPVPADGGEYLKFLIAVRRIAERNAPIDRRMSLLKELLAREEYEGFVERLRGEDIVLGRLFRPFLTMIPRLPTESIERLREMGLTTPRALDTADDKTLLSVPGIGSTRLRGIRSACAAASDMDEEFIDGTR